MAASDTWQLIGTAVCADSMASASLGRWVHWVTVELSESINLGAGQVGAGLLALYVYLHIGYRL